MLSRSPDVVSMVSSKGACVLISANPVIQTRLRKGEANPLHEVVVFPRLRVGCQFSNASTIFSSSSEDVS